MLGQVLNARPALRHARLQLGLPIYYCCEEELVSKPVGRPRKYSVDDLAACLTSGSLTTAEFRTRASQQWGIPRAGFYRLLALRQKELCFRQCATGERWELVSKTQQAL